MRKLVRYMFSVRDWFEHILPVYSQKVQSHVLSTYEYMYEILK